jgi:cytochrome c-type biogenesis protein CcmH/NrfF
MSATAAVADPTALPLAHIGHWLWVLYLIPVLIVVAGIIRTTRAEKRRDREERKGGDAPRRR